MGHAPTRTRARLRPSRAHLFIAAVLTTLQQAVGQVAAPTGCAQVHGVIDDDTISVWLDGARDAIPVTGVDTPERRTPGGLRHPIACVLSFHVRWTVTEYEHPSGEAPVCCSFRRSQETRRPRPSRS